MEMKRLLVSFVLLWLATVAAAAPFAILKSLGRGHRMKSLYEFEDGSGFVADLEVIQHTDTYGPDVGALRIIARYEAIFYGMTLSLSPFD